MAGAVMISFSGVYVKLAHIGPTASGFYRVFLGGVFLFLIAVVRRERLWGGFHYFWLQLFCGLIFALDLYTWHISIHYIGPGLATILANFQVFFLAIVGFLFFREMPHPKLLLSIPLAVAGLLMVVSLEWRQQGYQYHTGIALGLGTAVCYTGYILSLRKLQSGKRKLAPLSNLTTVSFASAFFLAILAGIQGESFRITDLKTAFSLLAYGFFSQVLGWTLISRGLPAVRASVAGLLLLLQPSLAFLWDMSFFDRSVTVISGLGIIVTLGAIYMGSAGRK